MQQLTSQYAYERVKRFEGNDLGNFARHDLAMEAKKLLVFWPFDLKVKASVGAGNWAAVPWLGFFDPLITSSATNGFYVVYLINADAQTVILSLNQGTTAVTEEFKSKANDVLQRRAISMVDRLPEFSGYFDTSPIDLGSEAALPKSYEAGHAMGKTYALQELEKPEFLDDLQQLLFAYQALVDRGGLIPLDVMQEQAGTSDIVETRKYTLSARIERSADVRKKVLKFKPPVCEACGLDPSKKYSFLGKAHEYPLDVHHAKPLRELAEGESRRYKIPNDFMVLCPTCHRMIHKQVDPSDLDALKQRISK